jgi:hypothetical protein
MSAFAMSGAEEPRSSSIDRQKVAEVHMHL